VTPGSVVKKSHFDGAAFVLTGIFSALLPADSLDLIALLDHNHTSHQIP
jgi:hypothetical protein